MNMGEIFRAEVLSDQGNPALRHACLQLITKLRLENAILNEQKSGPETQVRTLLRPENDRLSTVKESTREADPEKEFANMMEHANKETDEMAQKKGKKNNVLFNPGGVVAKN